MSYYSYFNTVWIFSNAFAVHVFHCFLNLGWCWTDVHFVLPFVLYSIDQTTTMKETQHSLSHCQNEKIKVSKWSHHMNFPNNLGYALHWTLFFFFILVSALLSHCLHESALTSATETKVSRRKKRTLNIRMKIVGRNMRAPSLYC